MTTISPIKRRYKLSKPLLLITRSIISFPSSHIPFPRNGTIRHTGRSGEIQFHIGLDQLFSEGRRGRTPVAHMFTQYRNGDGGRFNRSKGDKPGMIAELLRNIFLWT